MADQSVADEVRSLSEPRAQYGAFVRAKLAKGRKGRKHSHRDVIEAARRAARVARSKKPD